MTDLFDSTEPARPGKTLVDEFETFWKIYPRHVARKAAFEAFKKARRTTPLETIIAGVQRYAQHVQGIDPQYVLHASTWLNGERWTDELTPRQQPYRGTDALRARLRTEIENGEVQGYGGEGSADPRFDGRFPRLTH